MNGTTSNDEWHLEEPRGQQWWSAGRLAVGFFAGGGAPVRFNCLAIEGDRMASGAQQPLVELNVTGDGRARTTTRFTDTGVGSRLRYVRHSSSASAAERSLAIEQHDARTGLTVTTTLTASPSLAAARAVTAVRNDGDSRVVLEMVSTLAFGAVIRPGEEKEDLVLHQGTGEQLAENRWSSRPLWGQSGLADFNPANMGQPGRGAVEAVSTSTWSTARALPTAGLENARTGRGIAWQIEHNGGWRWEVDDVRDGEDAAAVVLMGPEDLDHHWSAALEPGQSFETVPASFALGAAGFPSAVGEMTRHRRWLRRGSVQAACPALVFNDYMNTLNGDPTTGRLLPLIDAARRAGAEYFCIDAGWYDDTPRGDWWPSVGAWEPSRRRFPNGGLGAVTRAIRQAGMGVGLWVEPEVVGVRSPVASDLPDGAFLQRHGQRVREQDRFFLDLRHPSARDHLTATVQRLIDDFGVTFFKLDYNVTPGPGTDHDAFSVGAGLLDHNRAHLAWIKQIRARHPHIVFENCSSGGMRADFAMLELFDFQSTSDQEDFKLYPAIAAGAPLQMLPEQAGNWAYPQPWMSDEEIAYTMTTGLSGRLYLSGFLSEMTPSQFELVTDATRLFKWIRADIGQSIPRWPLGYPQWDGNQIALALSTADRTLLYVWHRGTQDATIELPAAFAPTANQLVEIYPKRLPAWTLRTLERGGVRIHPGVDGPSARIFELINDAAFESRPFGNSPRYGE